MVDKTAAARLLEEMFPQKPKEPTFGERVLSGQAPQQAEMRPYDPTIREQAATLLQRGMERLGTDRYKARQRAETVIGGPSSNLPLGMGFADILPFVGTTFQTQEAGRALESAGEAAKRGDYVGAAVEGGMGALGLVPGALGVARYARPVGNLTASALAAAPKVPGALLETAFSGPLPGSREAQRGAIKMKGGNWLAGEVEGATEGLKPKGLTAEDRPHLLARIEAIQQRGFAPVDEIRQLDALTQNEALNNWIDKKLNRYIKNEMATPEDPVRKLAEQGILHYQPPAESRVIQANAQLHRGSKPPLGQNLTARQWEDVADAAIFPQLAEYQKAFGNIEKNPWLNKVSPETEVYGLSSGSRSLDQAGFDHLIDELKNAIRPDSDLPARLRYKPEDLEKVTMEQAVRRVHDINEYRAAKKAEANEALARNPATFTFKEYPTVPGSDKPNAKGLAWKEIREPEAAVDKAASRQQLQDALKYEGDVMGHCVGGYCDDVLSGRSQIYSLRDKKGEPHVTIEAKPANIDVAKWFSSLPQEEKNSILAAGYNGYNIRHSPQFKQVQNSFPPEIIQIKGKANRAPKEEYLPFVQDFVRGGNWSRVGDFQNTGLRDIERTPKLKEWLRSKNIETPRYLTEQEYGKYESDFLAEQLGMKKGGAVQKVRISDNPDTMNLELMMAGGGNPRQKLAKAIASGVKSLAKPAEKKSVLESLPKEEAKPYTEKQVQSTAEKLVPKIQKENPKLSAAEVEKRALRQAEQKLKWEKVEKPELESSYGALEKAKFSQSRAERLRNVPEVVEKRIQETRDFLKEPTEPWQPPRKELQAFERERIKEALEGFPGVEQTRFPRYQPARADLSYIDEIYDDPVNRELIKGQIARGLPLGGETFYASLYPLKLAALDRGIPEEKFNQFIYSIAPASARNSIMNEMAVGQFMRDMYARGLPLDEATVSREMAEFAQKYGKGLPLMPVHREGVKNVLEGQQDLREMLKADIPTNYKIPTYGTQKAGDFGKSMVLDVHESAGQTRGSRYHPYFTEQGGFGPTEYGAAEGKMLDIAGEMGIPGGMAQAGRWFGGGELTGLVSPRGDALDLLEKQAAYTLNGMGVKPTPRNVRNYILDMVETGQGVLMPWYSKTKPMPDVRTEKKKGGAVRKPRGKKVEITDNLDAMRLAVQK
jgi:hypothetical protein